MVRAAVHHESILVVRGVCSQFECCLIYEFSRFRVKRECGQLVQRCDEFAACVRVVWSHEEC